MIVCWIFGFIGVDLVNLLNEVVILIVCCCKEVIIMLEINDVVDRVVVGMEGILFMDGKSKWFIVYYEVGYVIVGILFKEYDFV